MVEAQLAIDAAVEHWRVAAGLLPVGEVEPQAAAEVIQQLRVATLLLDSVGRRLADVGRLADELARLARAAGGQPGYRFSLVYVAIRDHSALMEEENDERRKFFEATQASMVALLAGDVAEHDVMRDVANSHYYRSEKRVRSLARSAERMRQSMSEAVR